MDLYLAYMSELILMSSGGNAYLRGEGPWLNSPKIGSKRTPRLYRYHILRAHRSEQKRLAEARYIGFVQQRAFAQRKVAR